MRSTVVWPWQFAQRWTGAFLSGLVTSLTSRLMWGRMPWGVGCLEVIVHRAFACCQSESHWHSCGHSSHIYMHCSRCHQVIRIKKWSMRVLWDTQLVGIWSLMRQRRLLPSTATAVTAISTLVQEMFWRAAGVLLTQMQAGNRWETDLEKLFATAPRRNMACYQALQYRMRRCQWWLATWIVMMDAAWRSDTKFTSLKSTYMGTSEIDICCQSLLEAILCTYVIIYHLHLV